MKLENKKNDKTSFSSGFSLMEVIISVSILSMGIVASFSLISSSMAKFSTASNKIIASNLAQDGIERVRQVRDTNWLQSKTKEHGNGSNSWDDGIKGSGSEEFIAFSCIDGSIGVGSPAGSQIYLDNIGGYKCFSDKNTAGTPYSNFFRLIHVENTPGEQYRNKVTVTIRWIDRTGTHSFTAEEILYNWKETN